MSPAREARRGGPSFALRPLSMSAANAHVAAFHRHHQPLRFQKFALGAETEGRMAAVAMVLRPVSRALDDGLSLEVARLSSDGTPNACSFLLGACARAAWAQGYRRLYTYTLPEEGGASLRASGWSEDGRSHGRGWSGGSREREDTHPTGPKTRWRLDNPKPEPPPSEPPAGG